MLPSKKGAEKIDHIKQDMDGNGGQQLVRSFIDQHQDDGKEGQWQKSSQAQMDRAEQERSPPDGQAGVAQLFDERIKNPAEQGLLRQRRQQNRRNAEADAVSEPTPRLQ